MAEESAPVQEATTESANTTATSNAEGSQQYLSDDAALDKLFGKEAAQPEGRQRDAQGRFSSASSEPEQPQASQDEPEPDGDEPSADASEDVANPEMDRAVAALKRDGWSQSEIDSIPESRRVEMGLKRAKVQAEGDRIGNEYATLKGKPKDNAPKVEDSRTAEPEVDLKDAIEPLVEAYGEEIREPMTKLAKALQSQHQKQFQPVVEMLREVVQRDMRVAVQETRESLAKEYPQLKDESRLTEFAANCDMLAGTGKFDDVGNVMKAAAILTFGSEQAAEMKNQLTQKHAARQRATPSVSNRSNGKAVATTEADAVSADEDAILVSLQRGNLKEAEAIAYKRGWRN